MQYTLYDAGRCRSYQWITQPIPGQLSAKTVDLRDLFADFPVEEQCTSVSGLEQGSHNKAKMVVSGSAEKPLLGVLHRDDTPEGLCDCPLCPTSFAPVFAALKPFIVRAGLTPYNVTHRRGELKYVLLTESQSGDGMMLRFVLRSDTKPAQLCRALPWLQGQLSQLRAITVNTQPVHMAITEGEAEIYLTKQQALARRFNGVPLWIHPQSLFQTNPAIASQLYATTRDWVWQLPVKYMWDLPCGMGGFGLHYATPDMQLAGIEVALKTIICTKQSATELGLVRLQFQALDSTQSATAQREVSGLVLVSPPRYGIGKPLCDYLSMMAPRFIIYSSCNAQTMAKNIHELPGYRVGRIQFFDMFPHTAHYEMSILPMGQQKSYRCDLLNLTVGTTGH